MIYYFSATGNSAWVARKIAAATGDQAISMTPLMKSGQQPEMPRAGDQLGVVFPVHAWSIPVFVRDFLKKLHPEAGVFTFAVTTYGDKPGSTLKQVQTILRLDSGYGLQMPNTYLPLADIDPPEVQNQKISRAEEELQVICNEIKERTPAFRSGAGLFDRLLSRIVGPLFPRGATDTDFSVDESCTTCGTCVRVCPLDDIVLKGERPVWQGNCMHCMACIHHCPMTAIQYGKNSRKRGRYVFPEKEWSD
jgi:ferredoxin